MGIPAKQPEQRFNYENYQSWPVNERWELIDGIAYDMSPAPSMYHQRILMNLSGEVYIFLKDKPCKSFSAPFDVRFSEDYEDEKNITTIVQPDFSIICDTSKLDEKGCKGAPDFVAEILSPATAAKDMKQKRFLYEKYGVKEYWIFHPVNRVVEAFYLNDKGIYDAPVVYSQDEKVDVKLFPGLMLDLGIVFSF